MFAQCPNHAAYVVRPLFAGGFDGLGEGKFVAFAVIGGIYAHGVRAVFGGSGAGGRAGIGVDDDRAAGEDKGAAGNHPLRPGRNPPELNKPRKFKRRARMPAFL
mgnify:CR=1 FL=1